FGEDDPLLLDADYTPKPAYFGARDALASPEASHAILTGTEIAARVGRGPETALDPERQAARPEDR
ncbi:MAG TPA: hypothetical protein VLL75_10295, partial [Vicinamibacteria bacterium]|nr:hypothetical protein [Vicinamibacteria bacterium]